MFMFVLQRLGELTGDRLLVALKHSASVAAFFVVCGFDAHWTVTLHVVTRSKVRLLRGAGLADINMYAFFCTLPLACH